MLNAIRHAPATAVVVSFYLVLLVSSLVFDDDVAQGVAVAMLILLVVYCCLRPSRRLEVFGYAAAPGACGTLLHDFTGMSQKWGLVLVPLVVAWLVALDKEDRAARLSAS